MIAGIVLIIGAFITVTTTKERGSVPPKEKFTLAKAFKTVKSNDQLLVFMLTALSLQHRLVHNQRNGYLFLR